MIPIAEITAKIEKNNFILFDNWRKLKPEIEMMRTRVDNVAKLYQLPKIEEVGVVNIPKLKNDSPKITLNR